MTAQELKAIAEGLAPVVRDQIRLALEQERAAFKKTIAGLEQRLLEIETTPAVAPVAVKGEQGERGSPGESIKGDTGPAGRDGKDAEPVNIPSLIAAVLAAMPDPEKGERGEPGPAGKDAPAVNVQALARHVATLVPAGKDGAQGLPGRDGLNGRDGFNGKDGADGVDGKDGAAGLHGKDGAEGLRGKDGADGRDGKDGSDGLGFDDTDLVLDEVKGYVFRLTNGDRTKDYPVPWPWDANIWQSGRDYFKGASVTWDGHFWIAQRATSEQPGEGSTAWRLAVRRGKQGREGKKGDKGDPAPPQGPVFG